MTANKGKVLLQVQGLEKKFDDNQVLDGITTDICQGEVVAVIGHPVPENLPFFVR